MNRCWMPFGPLEGIVDDAAASEPTIHRLPAVPAEEVVAWTVGADVGLATGEHVCLSYELSMPNKLMRYLACGVPTLVNDLPEMERLVTRGDNGPLGWSAAPTAASMREVVQSITRNAVDERRERLRGWAEANAWELEAERMVQVYRTLGFGA